MTRGLARPDLYRSTRHVLGAKFDACKRKLKPTSLCKNNEYLDKGEGRAVLEAGLYQASAPWPPLIDKWPVGGSYKRTQIPLRKLYFPRPKNTVVAVLPATGARTHF